MIIDFKVIPNFFKDPDSVYDLAMEQKFLSWDDNPIDSKSVAGHGEHSGDVIKYNGLRTLPLGRNMEQDRYNSLVNEILFATPR